MKPVKIICLIAICSFVIVACNQKKQTSENEETTEETMKINVVKLKPSIESTDAFKNNISVIFNGYLTIKNQLVESNLDKVREAVSKLQKDMNGNTELVATETNDSYISASLGINSTLSSIIEAKDLEQQRMYFKTLTAQVEELIKKFGINDATVYQQYCPMAFNNTGASWLSKEEEIKNPYFGDQMLECGEVQTAYTF